MVRLKQALATVGCLSVILSYGQEFSAEAQELLGRADKNDPVAEEALGTAYATGRMALPINTVQAEFWYCKSLVHGNKEAGYKLGLTMASTQYKLDRKKYFSKPGYQHSYCDMDQIADLEPSLSGRITTFLAEQVIRRSKQGGS